MTQVIVLEYYDKWDLQPLKKKSSTKISLGNLVYMSRLGPPPLITITASTISIKPDFFLIPF